MFNCVQTPIVQTRAHRYELRRDDAPISVGQTFTLWKKDESFRTFFRSILSGSPYAAFRFETPPVTAATAGRAFEFVLVDAPRLQREADPRAFAEHFSAGDERQVATFANLGNDALLVVPRPTGPQLDYGHLAAFVRQAPLSQQHLLWAAVGAAAESRMSTGAVWVSTAGMGVPWLHLRIDSRPKYYSFDAYRRLDLV